MKSTVYNMQGAVHTGGKIPSIKQTVRTIVEVPHMKYLTAVLLSGEAPQTEILTRRGNSGLVSTVRPQQW